MAAVPDRPSVFIEEELNRKWSKCISDSAIKFGGGVLLGSVFSLLFFKRRRWPVLIGGGAGLGVAYSRCENSLNAIIQSN
ncbi:MICOS complex subunit Mic10-like [Cylas formicarius]|uniref:MICOS complex subunit Mic10-like n=1 Tax=Cylas formicarius TaxID=197179 RepID=UPI002958C50D|nr:MICOS complex subunit Mic10-like [Cylas formicarius]